MALSINTSSSGVRPHSPLGYDAADDDAPQATNETHAHSFESPSVPSGGFPPLPAHLASVLNDSSNHAVGARSASHKVVAQAGGQRSPAANVAGTRGASPQAVFSDGTIQQKNFPNLERGPLASVHAIVLHRTDSASAASTLAGYKTAQFGAHYLIDKDGTIYQTASTDKKAQHVGNIRSRHEEEKTLTPQEQQQISALKSADKGNYGKYVRDLHHLESAKPYPDRYPTNSDSLGIEVVGKYDAAKKAFEAPTAAQRESLARLVEGLKDRFQLSNKDIYHHGEISYKDSQRTEGTGLGY